MKKSFVVALFLLLSLIFVACGGDGANNGDGVATTPAEELPGNAQNGEDLYNMTTIADTGAPGCVTCHSVQATDDPLQPSPVGPSHYGLADRADDYVEDLSAQEYLSESIVEPDAHIVEGYSPGVMYQNYEEDLSDEQIDDLVAYLMTLHGD